MRTNASLFRATARLEDAMMRCAMPRVSAADPPLPLSRRRDRRLRGTALPLPPPLTFRLAEVAHAN